MEGYCTAQHSGCDVVQAAGDVAKVVLLRDDPAQVADAFRVARVTLNKIRQNLVWAFGYNVVAIPVAAGVLLPPFEIMLSPFISAALMAGSSLAVMGNSLLLRRETNRKNLITESAAPEVHTRDTSLLMTTTAAPNRRRQKKMSMKHILDVFESSSGSPMRSSIPSTMMEPEATVPAASPKRSQAVKSYSSRNPAPILPYRQAPRSEHPQEVARAAAPMRQGYSSSRAMPLPSQSAGQRQVDIRPGDIRTMLVGQGRTGRRT